MKDQDIWRNEHLDFVAAGFVFAAPDFDFVAADLAFVAADLDSGA
ncbi:MAG: hypothetical protein WBA40_17360 [Roseiarcus sp.]